MKHILIADDDTKIISALKLLLKSEGFKVTSFIDPNTLIEYTSENSSDIILTDLNFTLDTTSGEEGLNAIESIRKLSSTIPIIVMTGWATVEIAVNALKTGANDFIQKPWDNDRLLQIIHTQLKFSDTLKKNIKLSEENKLLRSAIYSYPNTDFISQSPKMKEVVHQIQRLSKSEMNILLTGENGTGKSMLAEYIHRCSDRSDESFISVNMGAIPEALFESEMFGHTKGAFTDAKTERIGRFELADNGTLFLDEIANIPPVQQSKLLRVLEEQKFEKVGSSRTQKANVRIISATNGNLEELVKSKNFREDLLFRLNTVEIEVPPLRNRKEDIIHLVNFFLEKFTIKYQLKLPKIHQSCITILENYSWPGNIRELGHTIERALFMNDDGVIFPDDLAIKRTMEEKSIQANEQELLTLDELEKNIVNERLNKFNGNAIEAAKSLGLSRSAFYRRLEK